MEASYPLNKGMKTNQYAINQIKQTKKHTNVRFNTHNVR